MCVCLGVKLSEGSTSQCVVLYIDPDNQCVEVAFTQYIVVDTVKRNKTKNKAQVCH